jgi:acetoin utilization protein AcuB
MKVREYMSTEVFTANLEDGLRQTFYRMRERGVRHMPVLGEGGELMGIISDRDLRRPDWVDDEENVAHFYLLDNAHKVKETMTPEPTVIEADAPVIEAVEIFVSRRFGALPVVDGDRRLVGMISALDLLRAFKDSAAG